MSIKQLAAQYVRKQLQVMKKYGSAPKLTAEQRREWVATVARTFERLQRTASAR